MLNVLDNIPKRISDGVERWVTGSKVPWFYFNHTLGLEQSGRCEVDQSKYVLTDLPRFTHYFYPNSKTPKEDRIFIMPLTQWMINNHLPGYEVGRVMGNMTTQLHDSSNLLNLPHMDSADPNKVTFLYYVNDSDGKTVFFRDKQIVLETDPKKGTGVLFSSNTIHAGQVPCINKTRYVINIIFSKRD